MTDLRERAVQLYDAFTHEHLDRRRLLREMTVLAGSAVAAEALIASIAPTPAAAQLVPADDTRLRVRESSWAPSGGPTMRIYSATPNPSRGRPGAVMVIHENRGLNDHIRDVTRRLALEGFFAFAPDFLSPLGGTPADPDAARAMFARLDLAATVATGVGLLRMAKSQRNTNGRVGAIGFCWGGAMVNRLSVAAGDALDAAVSYYGPAPDPAEAAKVAMPVMLHLAGKDARVNATGEPWAAALAAAGKPVQRFVYPDVDHAFNNDTSTARYNEAAAKLAWERTTAFLHRQLDARR